MSVGQSAAGSDAEHVIILHGLTGSVQRMEPLARRLRRRGYQVTNLGYLSTHLTIEEICDTVLAPSLALPAVSAVRRVHFVTHSFGGIIVLYHLQRHDLANRGRVVMLAPPSQGCRVLESLLELPLGRYVLEATLGPATRQIGRYTTDLSRLPALANLEVGVIAGSGGRNPLIRLLVGGPHDGKLAVSETMLPGMKDFLVEPCIHPRIMESPTVADQVASFLDVGQFRREASSAPINCPRIA